MRTAITVKTIDIGNTHSDLKNLFRRSNATTNHTRMAATVLTCNYIIPIIWIVMLMLYSLPTW
jgi:hypothetical protein